MCTTVPCHTPPVYFMVRENRDDLLQDEASLMKCASVRIFNTRACSPTVKQEFYVLSPFRIPFNPRRVKKNTYVHICTSNKETLKKGQHRIKKKLESNCGQTYLISTWNAGSTGKKNPAYLSRASASNPPSRGSDSESRPAAATR